MYNETPIRCFRFLNPRISLKRLAFKFENQIKNIYYSRKTVCFFPRIPAITCLGVHQKCVFYLRREVSPPLPGSMKRKHCIFQDERAISSLSSTNTVGDLNTHSHDMLPGPSSNSQKQWGGRQKDGLTLPSTAQSSSPCLRPLSTAVVKFHRAGDQ